MRWLGNDKILEWKRRKNTTHKYSISIFGLTLTTVYNSWGSTVSFVYVLVEAYAANVCIEQERTLESIWTMDCTKTELF